jgi:MFS transporter, FHS family, L-fucose permease
MVKHRLVERKYILPFILVTALFFLWGLPNSMNDILIKQFMKSFEIDRFQAGLIQFSFYMGYFLLAIPAAKIMDKYSYKTGLVIGLLLFGAGCFLFMPAASIGTYGFFLCALFVIASGLAFLETGANPYISVLGDPDTSEQRLNFSQAFNPFGVITGATIGTLFIFSGIEPDVNKIEEMKQSGVYDAFLRSETLRVVAPYIVIGVIVLILAVIMIITKFPVIASEHKDNKGDKGRIRDLLKYPHFIKSVIAQFFYVGAQVGTWSFFIQYAQDYTSKPEKIAGSFLIATFVIFSIGRFLATYFMNYMKPSKLMGLYSLINITLVSIAVLFPGWTGLTALFFTSFFMSLMFPTIFALGLKGLGRLTKLGGSLIVMGIVGGAVFPPIIGLIVKYSGSMAIAMVLPLLSYGYIAYYSYKGSETKGEPVVL